jgi:hypothetical protein
MNNKKTKLTAIICAAILCSCDTPKQRLPDQVQVAEISTLDTAENIARQIIEYVEQCDTGLITKRQLDLKAKPLQHSLDSMRRLLNYEDSAKLDEYRTALVNSMVDRKLLRKKNK